MTAMLSLLAALVRSSCMCWCSPSMELEENTLQMEHWKILEGSAPPPPPAAAATAAAETAAAAFRSSGNAEVFGKLFSLVRSMGISMMPAGMGGMNMAAWSKPKGGSPGASGEAIPSMVGSWPSTAI